MLILKTIGLFLKANWLYVAGGILVIALYWKVTSAWSDYKDWKDLQAQTITELTVSRDRAIVERASAQAAMAEKEAHIMKLDIVLNKTLDEQALVQQTAKEQKEAFEGHNLAKMAQRHGKWIEKIVNKGTQERMDDIETAFNQ